MNIMIFNEAVQLPGQTLIPVGPFSLRVSGPILPQLVEAKLSKISDFRRYLSEY